VRIWDVSPGYLNRQSLLGEHRELHGLHSILVNGKAGYSRHPETRRWVGCQSGLIRRHALLVAEMRLRGYSDRSPVPASMRTARWPDSFVTPPDVQLELLRAKYTGRSSGRIPLPGSPQELWAQHKYSVLARDEVFYRSTGRRVAGMRRGATLAPLAADLVLLLRERPPLGSLANAIDHMWGHVARQATAEERMLARTSLPDLLGATTAAAVRLEEPFLMASTALGELSLFVANRRRAGR
jgi:hypothetical protein